LPYRLFQPASRWRDLSVVPGVVRDSFFRLPDRALSPDIVRYEVGTMKISTKGRYGTRAMIDIGENHGNGPVPLRQLAERQSISMKYMEQIIPLLKASGLIRSVRGAKGGYALAKAPREITLGDMIQALEGSWSLVDCVEDASLCERSGECVTYEIWNDLHRAIHKILDSTTLADLIARQKKKGRLAARRKTA
jgi:Rrf2 family cysteine metabolism transcriptional repressor